LRFERFNGFREVPWNGAANAAWMHLTIERATINDLTCLLPLVAAYRAFYQRSADAGRERSLITQHLETGTSTIFIARVDGRAAGFVQLFQTYSTVMLGPQLILEDLFVDPGSRGGGVATKLLERAGAFACETGATGMFLETAMDNSTAQRVYERAGWTREARFYKYNAPV
jgi:ribosomal protein S18 acetylase RimI-like enzyme